MTTPALDYGFKDLSTMSELVVESPRHRSQHEVSVDADGKYITNTVKLNNNRYGTLDGFMEALPKIIMNPDGLSWIDLSFNKLTRIEPVCLYKTFPGPRRALYTTNPLQVLMQLKNLHILYLHGNEITDFPHMEILNRSTLLKTLTLHGNPNKLTPTLPGLEIVDVDFRTDSENIRRAESVLPAADHSQSILAAADETSAAATTKS